MGVDCWTPRVSAPVLACSVVLGWDHLGPRPQRDLSAEQGTEGKASWNQYPRERSSPCIRGQPQLRPASSSASVMEPGKTRAKDPKDKLPVSGMNVLLMVCPLKTLLICDSEKKVYLTIQSVHCWNFFFKKRRSFHNKRIHRVGMNPKNSAG